MFFSNKVEIPEPYQTEPTYEVIQPIEISQTISEVLNNSVQEPVDIVQEPVDIVQESVDIVQEPIDTIQESVEDYINKTRTDHYNEYDEEEDYEEEEVDDENTIYVITFDNKPILYERNSEDAKKRIDNMAKAYNLYDIQGYHTSSIRYTTSSEIDIIRSFDLGLFCINYTIHNIKIYRLQK